ncbi:MAG: Gfo/Idh/MocA family oxidoreductase [Bacteroidetes bacterium]|nr:Gfo/Idh/MocA family oxidoreductase [Bacteroidota bacterium]
MKNNLKRRAFLGTAGAFVAGSLMASPMSEYALSKGKKIKVALVGTGIRGTSFWGKTLVENFQDILEFVGLCDNNPGRLKYAADYMGVSCPRFSDFEKMIRETTPDLVIVTTKDSTHHEFIIKGLDLGCDVLTEKPLTTDEYKCQAILDAERRSNRKVIVGFNYRWGPYMTKIKELLQNGSIGKVSSVDFHWYLNTYHGASYFRRWHGLRQSGGTLWVHKATHHFDLLNWWLDSDPEEVFAYGDLEHYGSNGPFRSDKCRTCPHTGECKFYWDITGDKRAMDLYVNNEHHDGYVRDSCLFRPEINIYDKMSAQIKYSDNTIVNYSLTTYSPYEGWRIAFNGTEGRIDAWLDIPFMKGENISQSDMHEMEMSQHDDNLQSEPVIVHKLWDDFEVKNVKFQKGGHGGGDKLLHNQVFRTPGKKDPFNRAAGIRDGAMSILIGIAARKSIESGHPVRIAELCDLEPRARRI